MDKTTPFDSKDFKRVVMIAGEPSADLHGAHLVSAMKRLSPGIQFSGIGGENMSRAGVEILISASEMAVVGVTEVFGKLLTIYRAAKKIKSVLKNDRPNLLILIDYPDFNLHIAKTAKRFKTPVLYYISPQVWAWRRGRIRKIARRIDRMAVILPFEKAYYSQAPIQVDYVGHPLMDQWSGHMNLESDQGKMGSKQGRPVLGLLPGSRKEEIRNLLPLMVDAAGILGKRFPHMQCILLLAQGITPSYVQPFIEHSKVKINAVQGEVYEILKDCDAALVTSGTATLEIAIMAIPMVIVYRISPITFQIAKMVVKTPHIGLVNLVAEEQVAPELIQSRATPERLAQETMILLNDRKARGHMIKKLELVRKKLGEGGASVRTAKIALEMMNSL